MNHKTFPVILSALLFFVSGMLTLSCVRASAGNSGQRYDYPDIFDICYTPDTLHRCTGWFTDAGAWFGFTAPEREAWVVGFCGPFSLDMNRREWLAKAAVTVAPDNVAGASRDTDSVCYYPGELRLSSGYVKGKVEQRLNFIDSNSALLSISNSTGMGLIYRGDSWAPEMDITRHGNTIVASHPSGELVALTFMPDAELKVEGGNYLASVPARSTDYVVISLFDGNDAFMAGLGNIDRILADPESSLPAGKDILPIHCATICLTITTVLP